MDNPTLERMYILPSQRLDGITVYFDDYEVGKGMATVVCYGKAWNCYFGAMGDRTIKAFFASAYPEYLVDKLSRYDIPNARFRKKEEDYLTRIVESIQQNLKNQEENNE
jgi:hypothetical protein